jgi:hypothetical protein
MKLELYRQKLKYVGKIKRLENINEFFLVCVILFNFFFLITHANPISFIYIIFKTLNEDGYGQV